jgi:hypothetical protein
MGRSPLSGALLLWKLSRAGFKVGGFGYSVSLGDFAGIRDRLVKTVSQLAASDDYVLIGHSLGGVLLRSALNVLPPGSRMPQHLFLLGSPVQPARLAQKLQNNPIYRVITRDCGRLLGSDSRMSEIGPVAVPTTCIVGVRGLPWKLTLFRGEKNDGIVSHSEVVADWATEEVQVPVFHSLLPSSPLVIRAILERIESLRSATSVRDR